ncbi:unnamed protein product [Owenia fusiformis]|uniref:G-protein coupled receptors family 1 profile domain-containing protein n=1 Tax=Owenia fusiformis TaxID=6347 RepID=A0A8S4Q1Y8_OWEFU|nr:unnamed protein product [Owenia fusiformis]
MCIVSLAAADILVAGCVLPFNIAGVVLGEVYFYHRVKLCEFVGTVCYISCSCAYWCITGLAVNRMILVCSPKQYRRMFTWRTTPIFAFIPWCISVLTMIPIFISWGGMEFDPEAMTCVFDVDDMPSNMFVGAVLCVSVSLSFVSIIVAHLRIKAKRQQLTTIAPYISLMNATARAASDARANDKNYNTEDIAKELRQEIDDIAMTERLLTGIFISLLIWLPCLVAFLSHHIMNYGRDFWAFAFLLGHMQPGLDCLCYVIISKYFRRGYKNTISLIFCCKKRQEYTTVATVA